MRRPQLRGPGYQRPGPAALRDHRARNTPGFQHAEKVLGRKTVTNHAEGQCAPRGPAVPMYEQYLGIKSHAWASALELEGVGLLSDGKKPKKERNQREKVARPEGAS